MGRRKQHDKHLPKRMLRRGGSFYHVVSVGPKQSWTRLGKDYGLALIKWAQIEGQELGALTVEMAIASYLEHAKAGTHGRHAIAAETLIGYQKSAAHIIKAFGRMPLETVKRHHLTRYLAQRGNVAANRERALLSGAYSLALNLGHYEGPDPTKRMQIRNPERVRTRYVTDPEVDRLAKAASGRTGLLIRWAAITGMAQADILALRVSDATADGVLFRRTKTGRVIEIQWTDETRAIWKALAGSRIGSVPLYPSRKTNGHFTGSGFRAVWRRVKLKAGLKDVRFHDLRGKAGSDKDTDHEAQTLLGHADVRTTGKHYRRKPTKAYPVR